MKIIDLPIYEEGVARYRIPTESEHAFIVSNIGRRADKVAIDTETYYDPENKGVARFINGSPNNVPFCMTLTYEDEDSGELISYYIDEELIPMYKPLLEDESVAKILHNYHYDAHILKNIGIDIKGTIWDTMIMIHLIDEEHECRTPDGKTKQSKALKHLAYHYLGEDGHKYEDLVDEVRRVLSLRKGCAKSMISYKEAAEAAPLIMKDYACSDTEFTYQLFNIFYKELIRQELLIAYDVDVKATYAVLEMERHGIKVNMDYYLQLEEELQLEMDTCTAEINTFIDAGLNINSAADLVKGFESLGVEWLWFTDKGEHQTNDAVLKGIIAKGTCEYDEDFLDPPALLAKLVLQYREAAKLKNTFIAQIKDYVQHDGKVHADFNVCPRDSNEGGTRTGRLSSSNPNFQNFPKDDKRIRKGIVPSEGFTFVEMDYSAQEYRLLAHYAQDRNFSDILHQGLDVHTGTASMMLNIPYDEAKVKKNRDFGKRINFA